MVSLLLRQMTLLEEQITLQDNIRPVTNELIEDNSDSQTIFVIFTTIFVFQIFILSFLSFYFYHKFRAMYCQFSDFSASLFFILSLLQHKIPNYEELKKKFDENLKLSDDGSFFKIMQDFKLKKPIKKTVKFSDNKSLFNDSFEHIEMQEFKKSTGAIPKSILKKDLSSIMQEEANKNVIEELKMMQDKSKIKTETVLLDTKLKNAVYKKNFSF